MIPVILNLAIVVVIVGGLLWLLNFAPLDATIKKIGQGLILIVALVWALRWLAGVAH